MQTAKNSPLIEVIKLRTTNLKTVDGPASECLDTLPIRMTVLTTCLHDYTTIINHSEQLDRHYGMKETGRRTVA